jgi:hypothetical protein
MPFMFQKCSVLKDASAISKWDVSAVTSMEHAFSGCPCTPPSWYKA